MTRAVRQGGFTILELLLAGAMLSVMLAALGALLASTSRAYGTNEAVSADVTRVRAAAQTVRHDVALAGYCGVGADCDALPTPLTLDTTPVGGACHAVDHLGVAYVEDRFTEAPAVRTVAYRLADQQLQRSVDGGTFSPLADGVLAFEFCGYRTRSEADGPLRFSRPDDADLLGLDLRLRYQRGDAVDVERFTVTAPNAS